MIFLSYLFQNEFSQNFLILDQQKNTESRINLMSAEDLHRHTHRQQKWIQAINQKRYMFIFVKQLINNLMLCCKIVLLLVAIFANIQAITVEKKQIHRLNNNQTTSTTVKIDQPIRYTFIQYQGTMQLKVQKQNGELIANHNSTFLQDIISTEHIGNTLIFTLTSTANISVAQLTINTIQKYQLLSYHQQKFIHIKKGQTRIIQIIPKSKTRLIVERFDGIPSFINNLCSSSQKKECLDEMHRFNAQQMKKHIEVVDLQACKNCVLIVKITTNSPNTRIRMSIEANRTNVESYPSLLMLNKDQTSHLIVYAQLNMTGKIIKYAGQIQLSSNNMQFKRYSNGYNYVISSQKDVSMISIKGISESSFAMIQSPSIHTDIKLIDGLPSTFFIQNNRTYRISYENHNEGKTNIVLSSHTSFLQTLSIKFTNPTTHQNYLIRPKFLFESGTGSQSFQLDQKQQTIVIQIHLVSGQEGYLNISSQVNQYISLPLDFTYVNKLDYKEYDDYIVEGASGKVDVFINKCADCSLVYQISQEAIVKNPMNSLKNISKVQTIQMKGQYLFVRVSTNNFAYYSITVRTHIVSNESSPYLPIEQIQFFLQQNDEDNLLIQFHPPQCNKSQCLHTKYYLLQGSDYNHLASKIYCPFSLFNFDQRTKDILFQEIKPVKNNDIMSYTRPLKHRDYIGVIVEVNSKLLPYKVINTEDIKLYKSMKWPIFYLCLFVTAAVFCSCMIFMVLRKKAHQESVGYIRVSKSSSLQSIN